MKFTVEVDLDGDDLYERSPHRLARLLTETASKLRTHECNLTLGDCGRIRDANGNTVGYWKVVEEI